MKSAPCRLVLFLSAVILLSATPSLKAQEASATKALAGPTVTFKFFWEQGRPWTAYKLTVASTGAAHFEGVPSATENGDTDAFQQDFNISTANRDKIFELAKKLNYFKGDFDFHQKRIAKTGEKTLIYHAAPEGGVPGVSAIDNSTSYNFSQNADVQELTRLFQSIATTLDYGRKLAFQYRFDKLGLDARLRELQELQSSKFAEELNAIRPILQKIASDPNTMHISRETAQQLLRSLPAAPETAGNASQP